MFGFLTTCMMNGAKMEPSRPTTVAQPSPRARTDVGYSSLVNGTIPPYTNVAKVLPIKPKVVLAIPGWNIKYEYNFCPLQWRHNGRDSVSNHQSHHCLRLFRRRSKKTSKLRVTGVCVWNSPVTGKFPAHMAINAENVSIWWRHYVAFMSRTSHIWLAVCYASKSYTTHIHGNVAHMSKLLRESINTEFIDVYMHQRSEKRYQIWTMKKLQHGGSYSQYTSIKKCQWIFDSTHRGRVTHKCVNEMGRHWFRNWINGAKPLPESMLRYRQSGLWENNQWNLNRNTNLFIHENTIENVVLEMMLICLGLNLSMCFTLETV